jgi:glutamate racemase
LASAGLARPADGEGEYRFLCSGDVESFRELGTRFLQMPLGEVEHVDLSGHC